MLSQPSHLSSSAPVHSDASPAHSRVALPIVAHSSRAVRAASLNSPGKEKLWKLIAAGITTRPSPRRGCRSASHETLEAFNVWRTGNPTVGDNRGDQFIRRNVEREVVHGYTVGRELLIAHVRYFHGIALFDGDLLAGRERKIDG